MATETEPQNETVSAPDHAPTPAKKNMTIVIAAVLGILAIAFLVLFSMNQPPSGMQGVTDGHHATVGTHHDAVTIYFSKTQGTESIVEDVARPLPTSTDVQTGADPLRYALTELLAGPTGDEKAQGFYSEIPAGTKLLGLTYDGDTVNVNLSKQFEEGGGSTTMQQRLEELKRTVYAVDNRHTLAVSVEGRLLEILGGEGLEVPPSVDRTPQ